MNRFVDRLMGAPLTRAEAEPPLSLQPAGPDLPVQGELLRLEHLRADWPRHLREALIRQRCHTVELDQRAVLCRVLGSYKFLADARDLGLSPHLMLDGYWEMWCTEFMLRWIRPGQVAWDIGANLGYYAVLMADLVGGGGKVLAIEPNPRLAKLCRLSLELNGFWHAEVRELAAAHRSGTTLRFRANEQDPKNGHLMPEGTRPIQAEKLGKRLDIEVTTIRLDDLATGPVDFVKVDVEGAEEQVWAGMQGVLDANPDIIVLMELNAGRCAAPAETLAGMARRYALRELGLDGVVRPVEIPQILPRREDTLLVLSRQAL